MVTGGRASVPLVWEAGCSSQPETPPTEFWPARVPGAVQLDLARAKHYPDYGHGENWELFRWMEDVYHTCRTSFLRPDLESGQTLWFVTRGIDYRYEIRLNGRVLHRQEGMFAPAEVDLTPFLAENNLLEVMIFPAPKRFPEPDDRSQASHAVKPAVSYGWDWHPRLIPLGIWDETRIEIRQPAYIRDATIRYTLSEDLRRAELALRADVATDGAAACEWMLRAPDGECVIRERRDPAPEVSIDATLENPRLWWSHDHGDPELYESELVVYDKAGNVWDRVVSRIGFRRIRLVPNEGAWDEPGDFPKGPSVHPIQLELNGRRIFAKGTNWVNPEIFPGTITRERYEELLGMARAANFNILRVWGGGIVNKESFYDLCDRMGLLVWQEFPLACNAYPDDDRYLAVLEREATAIIRRLREHASLALWCGGNELYNKWSGMTEQSWPLRLLGALCYRHDRATPFLPTSPVYGMGHGNYVFRWEGKEVFRTMIESRKTAYTEFGIPGISPREVLERALPPNELFPPQEHSSWRTHHAYHAWDAMPDTWLCKSLLDDYFGPAASLDELIGQSQFMQSAGYKAIYEEARRQKPYCSMALNWCFNDVWPAAANNSLIAYPALPKPALGAVAASCRPVCASARLPRFVWTAGEPFEAELWLLNDRFEAAGGLRVRCLLLCQGRRIDLLEWNTPPLKPNRNVAGPTARCLLPEEMAGRFTLRLEVEDHPDYDSEYGLLCRRKGEAAASNTMNV